MFPAYAGMIRLTEMSTQCQGQCVFPAYAGMIRSGRFVDH